MDDLRRTQSLGCLAESGRSSADLLTADRDRCRGIVRCSSSGAFGSQLWLDVLIGGGGGEDDDDDQGGAAADAGASFNYSVNNLDNDCVSPRVSTNSLASQMDNNPLLEGVLEGPDPPLYYAPHGGATAARISRLRQHLSPRGQLLIAGGGGGCGAVTPVDADGVPVSRSTSCPSVAHQVRRHPLSSATARPPFGGVPAVGKAAATGALQPPQGRPPDGAGGSKFLQVGSVESDSFNVTTPTEEGEEGSVDRVSPHYGDTDFRAEADRMLEAVERQQVALRQTTAAAAASTALNEHRSTEIKNSVGASLNGSGEKATTTATTAGKLSRSLARSKCLQWLNSLDEGD